MWISEFSDLKIQTLPLQTSKPFGMPEPVSYEKIGL